MKPINRFLLSLLTVMILTSGLVQAQQIITTCVGNNAAGHTYTGEGGMATAAGMYVVYGMAVDAAGNIFVAEGNEVVRKVDATGKITTYAGTGIAGYTGDGGAATLAELKWPTGIAADASGNVFVTNAYNNVIRKINSSGTISTYAGSGTGGFGGDGGAATLAKLNSPQGLAVDAAGNLYIADCANNRIRKVSTTGVMTTVAGTGIYGYTGDGGVAATATLRNPTQLTIDAAGNLYIADMDNNVIRKMNTSGIISTVAGNGFGAGMGSGMGGHTGDGGPATNAALNSPQGLAIDGAGNLYISDRYNDVVRVVNTAGVINNFAGTGTKAYSGDGGAATAAEINYNWGLATDVNGRLYIADEFNFVVRRVEREHVPAMAEISTIPGCKDKMISINSSLAIIDSDVGQTERWSVVSGPVHGTLGGFDAIAISTGSMVTPTGLTYVPTTGYTGPDSFKIQIYDDVSAIITTQYVMVATGPDAGTITGTDSVCPGHTITLSDNVAGGNWTMTNSLATASLGAITGTAPGIDTVLYIATNGCGKDTATKVIKILSAGACPSAVYSVLPQYSGLVVYPNPSSGSLAIQMPDDAVSVSITDLIGKTIQVKNVDPNIAANRVVHFDHIPAGNYVISVAAANKTYRAHVVVW